MAQKRMFDKSVVDSDDFLEMPLTTQALYFHLNMRADDDGFIDNWKTIMRIIGAKEDDLKVLFSKQYIIPFDSGVIVIRHWKINNYLQKDRKKSTRHVEEIQQLKEINGEYFLLEDGEISNILLLDEQKELPEWQIKRDKAYKESSLPYSFLYKIRNAFNYEECPICKNIMTTSGHKKYIPTIQHLLPISKGGKHELDNIAIICFSCNSSIRDKEITDKLNNDLVIKKWNEIIKNDKHLTRLTSGSTDKNRIDKNRIDKNSIYNTLTPLYDILQENGFNLSPIQCEVVDTWEDNELTRYAIKQAVINNKFNIKYVDKILYQYQKDNIKTVQQAIEREEEFNNKKKNYYEKKYKTKSDRDERIEEWLKDEQE